MLLIGLVLILAVTVVPGTAEAQGTGRIPRVGLLFTGSPPLRSVEAFRTGLRELGYVEGRDIALAYRVAPEGRADQLPKLAGDLVRMGVDVIVARATAHTVAAKQATSSIPIVFGAVSDPLRSGLVASLARPGANITGLSLQAPDVARKLMEVLKETLPNASRIAALADPSAAYTVVVKWRQRPSWCASTFNCWTFATRRSRRHIPGCEDWSCGGHHHSPERVLCYTPHPSGGPRLEEPGAGCTERDGIRGGGRSHILWAEHSRQPSAGRHICGQDPQRRQAQRTARGATHEVRASDQPQDRQGAMS